MREPFKSAGGVEGGRQVALVKASTKRRTKKRGKVPPRLETLGVGVSPQQGVRGGYGVDLRCEKSHVRASNRRVGDLRVESRYRHEHDRVRESAVHVHDDDKE